MFRKILSAGAVRGVAVEWVSRRLYWTEAGAGGGVHCAALDGARRTALVLRDDAEPDDIVLHNDTGQMFWTDRGAAGGLWAAALDGRGARRLLARRARRLGALALYAPAQRLYVVDAYYDTLESVRVDGGGRVTLAAFTQRPDAPRAPHVYVDGGEPRRPPPGRGSRVAGRAITGRLLQKRSRLAATTPAA